MRPVLPLALALAATPALAENPFDFLADGAGAAELDGTVSVDLLRGVDTDGQNMVFATKPDAGEGDDPFLLGLSPGSGANLCTEAVVGALGGWVKDETLTRRVRLGKKTIKVVTKVGYLPGLQIGDLVLRDVHCEIDPAKNLLSLATLDEVAVAVLPSEGQVRFAPAAQAESLLTAVGEPVEAEVADGGVSWLYDQKVAIAGRFLLVPATVAGRETRALLTPVERSFADTRLLEDQAPTFTRAGALYSVLAPEVAGQTLPDEPVALSQDLARTITAVVPVAGSTDPEAPPAVALVVGADHLIGMDWAVDAATGRVAIARADELTWTDPSDVFLEAAREAYQEGEDGSAILLPARWSDGGLFAAAARTAPTCTTREVVSDPGRGSLNGVRAFGEAVRTVDLVEDCPDPVDARSARSEARRAAPNRRNRTNRTIRPDRQSADEDPQTEGTAEGSDDDASAKKEARRKADLADVLWTHGDFDEALDLYAEALEGAGEDCSYYHDFAQKALVMGRTKGAITNAGEAGELYEKWASQPLETRLEIQGGSTVDGAYSTPQADVCHTAWGIRAAGFLARDSHDQVSSTYDERMDLDESLALAYAMSQLERGRPDRAHGPLIQALNVGGRGDLAIHLALGLAAEAEGRPTAAEGNLERLHHTQVFRLLHGLGGLELSRRLGGAERAQDFVERARAERPGQVVPMALAAIEARRRGDVATLEAMAETARADARAGVDRRAGTAASWCNGAALLAAVGDDEGARSFMDGARGRPGPGGACLTAAVVMAAASGDAQATTKALEEVALRFPGHVVGTLRLVQPLPPLDGSADGGEPAGGTPVE